MSPSIHQAFWSDPEIEAAPAEIKLAVLWLITNSQTSILGLCRATEKRFGFETGLPSGTLGEACKLLPRMLLATPEGIWIRNYIHHQFGRGAKLTRNNCFSAIRSAFGQIRGEELQQAVMEQYPEFSEGSQAKDKPLISPSEGLERGKVRESKEEESKRNGEPGKTELPADPELSAEEIAATIQRIFNTARSPGGEALHAIAQAMPVRASEMGDLERFYALPPDPNNPRLSRCIKPTNLALSLADELVKARDFLAAASGRNGTRPKRAV